MSTHRQLVLCPYDLDWQPGGSDSRSEILKSLGLIGKQVLPDSPGRYLIGEQFLQHVNFMGCSPALQFEPDSSKPLNWEDFVFIYLPEVTNSSVWLADSAMAKPACPSCNKRNRDWLSCYDSANNTLRCIHCQQVSPVCGWNWFDAGGCGRYFICIVNVYPREALLSDHFLQQLAKQSGTEWHYFYVNTALPVTE